MITVQKMRLYGLGIAFACFAWVGATAQTPYGWRGPEVAFHGSICFFKFI